MIDFLFKLWVRALEFLDLLGTDNRPSSTKMMSFGISVAVLITALHRTFHNHDADVWTWPMFWILFLCCGVMFGRWGFDRFIKAIQNKNLS
jgi:hypothetical protein